MTAHAVSGNGDREEATTAAGKCILFSNHFLLVTLCIRQTDRNQEQCRSCWAFAASEALSDRFAFQNKTAHTVSSNGDIEEATTAAGKCILFSNHFLLVTLCIRQTDRNQEQCRSCWAFAASEALSDRFAIHNKTAHAVSGNGDREEATTAAGKCILFSNHFLLVTLCIRQTDRNQEQCRSCWAFAAVSQGKYLSLTAPLLCLSYVNTRRVCRR